ncbi:arsenite efflux transporter metallochaperone ArsD [Hafnia psychrotolerans]|jgi:hypothetical protein|uniref:Arsenic resistance operon repressor n=1 Tax=Hafnia psychrotolerans TaxID=1477018 RepID=A0ABQ1G0E0_9GAMM|nr:arsenite efflux transporter metallochaperone ArsD [Hafnia psychrotolerans]GGA33602.1 arsenic resistance operon repressor [Hafnia psychrotolerans]
MKTISVFDPAMCCNTGVCGTEVDQALVSFSADCDWLKQKGITVKRFNLSQQPMAFVDNTRVKAFLDNSGTSSLPLIMLDDEVALAGRYPTRQELARWCDLALESEQAASSGCCTGGKTTCC